MFYADWCLFCQRFKPILESAITTKPASNGYKFYESKVNDDDNPLWDKIISRRDAKMGVGLNESDLDSMLKEV